MTSITTGTSFTKVFSNDSEGGLVLLEDRLESSNFYSNPLSWIKEDEIKVQLQHQQQEQPIIYKSNETDKIIQVLQNIFNQVPSSFKEKPILYINSLSSYVYRHGISKTCNLLRTLSELNFTSTSVVGNSQKVENKKSTTTTAGINKIETGIDGSLKRNTPTTSTTSNTTTTTNSTTSSRLSSSTRVSRTFHTILSLLHTDLHETDPSIQKQLQYISNVSIQVTPLPPKLRLSETLPHPYESTITIVTKKRSGRVVRNVEYYYINKIGKIEFDSGESLQVKQQSKEVDPTENLSFNLKLTDEEKKAKESVVLPYRHQGNNESTLIIEDPDQDDDYDDEDPDDDLDI
eukprot:gene8266-10156_t